MLKILLTLVAFAVCLASSLPAYGKESRDGKEISKLVQLALENSPAINSAQRELNIADLNKSNALAGFFPTLDLSSSHGLTGASPLVSNNPWASSVSVELKETIYDNGSQWAKWKISQIRRQEQELEWRKKMDQLTLQILQEYFQLALAEQASAISKNQIKILQTQADLVKAGYKQGVKTRKDHLRFQAQVLRAEVDLQTAIDGKQKSENNLKELIGVDLPPLKFLDFEQVNSSDATVSPKATNTHRDIVILKMKEEVAKIEEGQVWRKMLPEINLTASAKYGSDGYINSSQSFKDRDQLSWNALIGLNFNFIDWGTRRREGKMASEKVWVQENQTRERVFALEKEYSNLVLDLNLANQKILSNKSLMEIEKDSLELVSREYRQGKAEFLDYITSLKDFSSAKLSYFTALVEFKKLVAQNHFNNGSLYEKYSQ